MNKYDDIINLPHHKSTKHQAMSLENRASQFAPFSALNGYDDAILETARITDQKIELADYQKEIINKKLYYLKNHLQNEEIEITYFIFDDKKLGGKYKTIISKVKKILEVERFIVLEDGSKIAFDLILQLKSKLLSEMEE